MTNPHGSSWITKHKRAAIYERDGWKCAYCGRSIREHRNMKLAQVTLTLDHLTPRIEGGTNEASNLVTACTKCNSSRQDKPWREYATGGAIERIELLITLPLDIKLGKAIIASLRGDATIEAAR